MKEQLVAFFGGFCMMAGMFVVAISTFGAIAYLGLLTFSVIREIFNALY
jgi:hypothetical protein